MSTTVHNTPVPTPTVSTFKSEFSSDKDQRELKSIIDNDSDFRGGMFGARLVNPEPNPVFRMLDQITALLNKPLPSLDKKLKEFQPPTPDPNDPKFIIEQHQKQERKDQIQLEKERKREAKTGKNIDLVQDLNIEFDQAESGKADREKIETGLAKQRVIGPRFDYFIDMSESLHHRSEVINQAEKADEAVSIADKT